MAEDKREVMREKINSLRIPFNMKRTAWEYYIRGYDDACQELHE